MYFVISWSEVDHWNGNSDLEHVYSSAPQVLNVFMLSSYQISVAKWEYGSGSWGGKWGTISA